jgi:hypothetical protein
MSILHVDLKIPGGTYKHDPLFRTTTFVGYVPSKPSSALWKKRMRKKGKMRWPSANTTFTAHRDLKQTRGLKFLLLTFSKSRTTYIKCKCWNYVEFQPIKLSSRITFYKMKYSFSLQKLKLEAVFWSIKTQTEIKVDEV